MNEQNSSIHLTVVIPLYNKQDTVRRAVKSVLDQLEEGDRLIVVDDGSTDNSGAVVEALRDARLRLVSQENLGVSAARNRGMDMASTEHIAFLDADDWWFPGVISQYKWMISQSPECVIYCVGHVRCQPGDEIKQRQENVKQATQVVSGVDFIRMYAKEPLINSSTCCVKNVFLNQIGGFPVGEGTGEDIYVWLRLAILGPVSISRRPVVAIERASLEKRPVRDAVPFYVEWFSNRSNVARLRRSEKKAISRFLFWRGIGICAGRVGSGRRHDVYRQVIKIARIQPFFLFVGAVLLAAPSGLIRFVHKRKYEGKKERAR